MIESEQEIDRAVESGPTTIESPEKDAFQGAEMLESPQDGNFVMGLQTFVAWVKSLVAPHN